MLIWIPQPCQRESDKLPQVIPLASYLCFRQFHCGFDEGEKKEEEDLWFCCISFELFHLKLSLQTLTMLNW